jgi:hypothetical protein
MKRYLNQLRVAGLVLCIFLASCVLPGTTDPDVPAMHAYMRTPGNNAIYGVDSGSVNLSAYATNESSRGGVSSFEFFANGSSIGTQSASIPLGWGGGTWEAGISWDPTAAGVYRIQVAAYNASGVSVISDPIRVCVIDELIDQQAGLAQAYLDSHSRCDYISIRPTPVSPTGFELQQVTLDTAGIREFGNGCIYAQWSVPLGGMGAGINEVSLFVTVNDPEDILRVGEFVVDDIYPGGHETGRYISIATSPEGRITPKTFSITVPVHADSTGSYTFRTINGSLSVNPLVQVTRSFPTETCNALALYGSRTGTPTVTPGPSTTPTPTLITTEIESTKSPSEIEPTKKPDDGGGGDGCKEGTKLVCDKDGKNCSCQ